MAPVLLLTWLAKATLVLLLAAATASVLRRASAGMRYMVWLAGLAGLLLLPAAAWISPFHIAVLPPVEQQVSSQGGSAGEVQSDVAPAAGRAGRFDLGARGAPPTNHANTSAASERNQSSAAPINSSFAPAFIPTAANISRIALVAWVAITGGILAWLAFGAWTVRRITRGATRLEDDSWTVPLYEVADRLQLDEVPALLSSDRIQMPFACGVLSPAVVLPSTASSWTDERRRAVLFHELAHIRRRDLLGHTLGRVTCALYWFHPLVWGAARRLRAESERACDDLVLSCGARASDYANHLLDIVTSVRGSNGAPAAALPMANRKEFEGRMLAILDPEVPRRMPSRARAATLVSVLGIACLTVAATTPVSRSSAPVAAVGATLGTPAPLADVAPSAAVGEAAHDDADVSDEHRAARPVTSTSTSASVATSTVTEAMTSFGNDIKVAATNIALSTAAQVITALGEGLASGMPKAKSDSAVALLVRVLRTDKSAEVRKSAAWALQGATSAAAVSALTDALRSDSDDEVRETAAWALAHNDAVSPTVFAAALASDRSAEVRETAAWALGNHPSAASIPALEKAINDSNSEVRHAAIWALGQHRTSTAPAGVIAALKDSDPEVREIAAWALGNIRDRNSLPALRAAFLAERGEPAETILWALRNMGDKDPAIIEKALQSSDPELRAHGVMLLAGKAESWPMPMPWPQPRPSPE